MFYSEQMKNIRKKNNCRQVDIANILGINIKTYNHYETQDTIIPIKHLIKFCDSFKVSIDYVFMLSTEINYNNIKENIDLNKMAFRLKELRKENKLSQEELAKILECSDGTIAGYEIGRYIIATPFLYEICSKYKVSADYLLGKTNEPKYLN